MNVEDRLVIDSRLDAIAQARNWLAERAGQAGFPSDTISDLKLAISEAITNVVRHAYNGEPDHQIILSLVIDDKALTLTIRDFGRPFDASGYRPPDLNEPQEAGYGMFLMHSLMDEVHYDTSSGVGTTLTLVKRRGGTPSTGHCGELVEPSGQDPSAGSGQAP